MDFNTEDAVPVEQVGFQHLPGARVLGSTKNDQQVIEEQAFSRDVGSLQGPAAFGAQIYDSFTSGGNVAYSTGQYLYRKFHSGPADPSFDQEKFITDNRDAIPDDQSWRFMGTQNQQEADWLLGDYKDSMYKQRLVQARGGVSGFVAGMIAGVVDLDAPLMFLSGGVSAAAKVGINATRIGRLMSSTAGGALMGLGFGAADYQFNPTAEADDIMLSVAFGAGLGTLGGLAGMRSNLANEIGEGLTRPNPHQAPASVGLDEAPFGFTARQPAPEAGVSPAPVADVAGTAPRAPRAVTTQEVPVNADSLDAGALPEVTVGQRSPDASSAGARFSGGQQYDGLGVQSIDSPDIQATIADAERFVQQNSQAVDGFFDPTPVNAPAGYANAPGALMGKIATKLGIGNDFSLWMRSNNPIKQQVAMLTMEDPSGKVRFNQTAAVLKRDYEKQFGKDFSMFEDHARQHAYQNLKLNMADVMLDPGASWRQDFMRDVQLEIANRRYGRGLTTNKQVKDAADAVARFYETDIRIGKGEGTQVPIGGYERLDVDPTYQQQRWSGSQMQRMLDDAYRRGGKRERDQYHTAFERALEADYLKMHPTMAPASRRKMAKAVVDRALTTRKGMGRDLFGLLMGDEADVVKAALRRQGMDDAEIQRVIGSIMGTRENRAQPGQTKARVEVDPGSVFQHSGIEIRMIDLLDNDLQDMMRRRMSRTSGQAALARMGLPSKIEFEKLRAASNAFETARGKPVKAPSTATSLKDKALDLKSSVEDALDNVGVGKTDDDMWDDLYSHFSGQAVSGGISPGLSRIKKVTTLSLMNGVGMSSLAEFGPIAAQMGWKNFWKQMPDTLRAQFGKKGSPLMEEFEHMGVFVPDHHIHNSRWNFESERDVMSGDKLRMLDKGLNTALDIQGHLSAGNLVRDLQQRIAMTGTTSKLFKALAKGDQAFSPERLTDMGFDAKTLASWKTKYIDTGIVQMDAEGNLVKTNMDNWDYDDVQYFRNAMARTVDQLVQRAMVGESSAMFHKDGMASLFFQFKSFPLLALEKQYNRNTRIGDPQALFTFMYGLLFAGVAYSARQVVAGRPDNLTPEKIAAGAFNYSNMTGWLPMWADPVGGALGLDSSQSRNGVGSVVSIPASFGVMERLAQLPASMARVTGRQFGIGEYDNNDLRNLMAFPIAGQMFGMQALLNMGRDQGKDEPQRPRPAPKPPAPEPKPAKKPVVTDPSDPDYDPVAQALQFYNDSLTK